MNRWIIISLCVFFVIGNSANSIQPRIYPRCFNLDQIFGSSYLHLPSRAVDILQKHKIWALSRKLQDERLPIVFDFPSGSESSLRVKKMKRLLQEIFPTATFTQGRGRNTDLGRITLELAQPPKEKYLFPNPHTTIDVNLAEGAMPYIPEVSKSTARKSLQIQNEKKVMSLYVSGLGHGTATNPDVEQIIHAIHKNHQPDIIFLSAPPANGLGVIPTFDGYQSVELGEFQRYSSKVVNSSKWLVYNDSEKKLIDLLAASNYTVINGDLPLFESLHAKTPVIYFEKQANHALGKQAQLTGGAKNISKLKELDRAIGWANQIRNIPHPALVQGAEIRSVFEVLLDRLESIISAQRSKASNVELEILTKTVD